MSGRASDDHKRGYSKGYAAGRRGAWPLHRPPTPPHEAVRKLMDAAMGLRNAVDTHIAMLSEDDEFVQELGPLVDDVDAAFEEIGKWLSQVEVQHADDKGFWD